MSQRNKTSVVIIEDDQDLLAIMMRYLESEGYEVIGAASAEDAYGLLAQRAFSMIIVDINLPGDDGIEFCRQLRKTASTPVIFASARVGDDARALSLESGGDAYLSKPFSLRELLAQVKAVECRMVVKPARTVACGLTIDPVSRQVVKNGEPIQLSPKEFELAQSLMRNPGVAMSKDQLIADVWGAFSDVEPQTLAVHMRWLREKIEDDPAHPVLFETLRGFGYRFKAQGQKTDGEENSRL